jgi:transposase
MSRRYARSLLGERAHDAIPLNRGKATTIVSSVRLDGPRFRDYVESHLAPTLHEDDIVVMDNLPTHKVSGIREAIEAVGAHLVYLPPYSPDLNPTEEMWSKIKAFLRKVKARSQNALLLAIPDAFHAVCVSDILGWFSHAGYDQLCNC